MPPVPRPRVAPPGARVPLVLLVAALAAGAALIVLVHRGLRASAELSRPPAVVAAPAAAHARADAMPRP